MCPITRLLFQPQQQRHSYPAHPQATRIVKSIQALVSAVGITETPVLVAHIAMQMLHNAFNAVKIQAPNGVFVMIKPYKDVKLGFWVAGIMKDSNNFALCYNRVMFDFL